MAGNSFNTQPVADILESLKNFIYRCEKNDFQLPKWQHYLSKLSICLSIYLSICLPVCLHLCFCPLSKLSRCCLRSHEVSVVLPNQLFDNPKTASDDVVVFKVNVSVGLPMQCPVVVYVSCKKRKTALWH